jgi:hypothetical protein
MTAPRSQQDCAGAYMLQLENRNWRRDAYSFPQSPLPSLRLCVFRSSPHRQCLPHKPPHRFHHRSCCHSQCEGNRMAPAEWEKEKLVNEIRKRNAMEYGEDGRSSAFAGEREAGVQACNGTSVLLRGAIWVFPARDHSLGPCDFCDVKGRRWGTHGLLTTLGLPPPA